MRADAHTAPAIGTAYGGTSSPAGTPHLPPVRLAPGRRPRVRWGRHARGHLALPPAPGALRHRSPDHRR